ncbi:MAG: hypothetical protein BAJALOKI3v1_120057 [Promethearchaeota archaeon]|nr:MAG: hypothetical protein BAJALOKI3v1_120057 [Candidatus Lokiarchaeota archaeon]
METRNFYILVASIAVGLASFWLTIYAIVTLDVDIFQDPNTIQIKGNGINGEITLSVNELSSDPYQQVKDKTFTIKNKYERVYYNTFTGVSLWSIIEQNQHLLLKDPSELTFLFKARDAYQSPKPLNLSIAQNNPTLVILAYLEDGYPLFEDGPIRAIIDQSVVPEDEYSSQYTVKYMASVIIE